MMPWAAPERQAGDGFPSSELVDAATSTLEDEWTMYSESRAIASSGAANHENAIEVGNSGNVRGI